MCSPNTGLRGLMHVAPVERHLLPGTISQPESAGDHAAATACYEPVVCCQAGQAFRQGIV